MQTIKARVTVTLKPGVLDPQGAAIENALRHARFTGSATVRQGKIFDIELLAPDRQAAQNEIDRMCKSLLANLVIEDYAIAFVPATNG